MKDPVALLSQALETHSLRALAKKIGVSAQFLCMVRKGDRQPGGKVLAYFGFKRQVTYQRVKS